MVVDLTGWFDWSQVGVVVDSMGCCVGPEGTKTKMNSPLNRRSTRRVLTDPSPMLQTKFNQIGIKLAENKQGVKYELATTPKTVRIVAELIDEQDFLDLVNGGVNAEYALELLDDMRAPKPSKRYCLLVASRGIGDILGLIIAAKTTRADIDDLVYDSDAVPSSSSDDGDGDSDSDSTPPTKKRKIRYTHKV